MSEPGAAEADCASLFMLISLQLGGLPRVKRPAQLDQAPARGERVQRLPSRRGHDDVGVAGLHRPLDISNLETAWPCDVTG
jgi:hypothetical protein